MLPANSEGLISFLGSASGFVLNQFKEFTVTLMGSVAFQTYGLAMFATKADAT